MIDKSGFFRRVRITYPRVWQGSVVEIWRQSACPDSQRLVEVRGGQGECNIREFRAQKSGHNMELKQEQGRTAGHLLQVKGFNNLRQSEWRALQ